MPRYTPAGLAYFALMYAFAIASRLGTPGGACVSSGAGLLRTRRWGSSYRTPPIDSCQSTFDGLAGAVPPPSFGVRFSGASGDVSASFTGSVARQLATVDWRLAAPSGCHPHRRQPHAAAGSGTRHGPDATEFLAEVFERLVQLLVLERLRVVPQRLAVLPLGHL